MRLRNIPGSKEAIAASVCVVQTPEAWKGRWREYFVSERPIRIEVGMGKGRFIMDMAAQYPEISFIGIERYDSVLLRAVQKREKREEDLPNLAFIRMDARNLVNVFAPGEVDRIYLNFPDPWPKDRHAKRRLTSREFLTRYDQILARGGRVECKTDNRDLFAFSLAEAKESPWRLTAHTRDLHGDEEMARGNIMTEYEEKFSAQGVPICKMILERP